jgi:hypothetical protein
MAQGVAQGRHRHKTGTSRINAAHENRQHPTTEVQHWLSSSEAMPHCLRPEGNVYFDENRSAPEPFSTL